MAAMLFSSMLKGGREIYIHDVETGVMWTMHNTLEKRKITKNPGLEKRQRVPGMIVNNPVLWNAEFRHKKWNAFKHSAFYTS